MTLEQIKQAIPGEWISIAPEIRPSLAKNADGSMRPFYLTRAFTYLSGDGFELIVINVADPYGKTPLIKIGIKGHMKWRGEYPIKEGAQKVFLLQGTARTKYPP